MNSYVTLRSLASPAGTQVHQQTMHWIRRRVRLFDTGLLVVMPTTNSMMVVRHQTWGAAAASLYFRGREELTR